MMITIQKHEVANIPSENTLYSWKVIKRTIKKPTQPIPKQTSLPKHRLEFPRFVIAPCSPEPLFTLGKILIGISQPRSLPSIQSQEFGLGLMQRKREILLHWRERSKSFLPQVHSILQPSPVTVTANLQSWAFHLQSDSPPRCACHPFPVLGSSWTFRAGQYWGASDLVLVSLWGCRSGCTSLVWLLFILTKLLFAFEHDKTFLIQPDNKAGWLFAPRCMNASLYCICIISATAS